MGLSSGVVIYTFSLLNRVDRELVLLVILTQQDANIKI
jgi:hypothetical protein